MMIDLTTVDRKPERSDRVIAACDMARGVDTPGMDRHRIPIARSIECATIAVKTGPQSYTLFARVGGWYWEVLQFPADALERICGSGKG